MCFDVWRLINWGAISVAEREKILTTAEGEQIFSLGDSIENVNTSTIEEAIQEANLMEATSLVSNMQKRLNISELFRATLDGKELFGLITYFDPKEVKFTIADDNFVQIKRFAKDSRMCYLFDVKDVYRRNINYASVRRLPIVSGTLAALAISDKYVHLIHEGVYSLNPAGDSFYPDSSPFLLLPFERGIGYTVTYNEYQSKLLPPPYATGCLNYSKAGFTSRGGCYDICMRKESLKMWKRLHPALTIFPSETEKPVTFTELLFSEKTKKESLEIYQKCNVECSQRDCSTVLYAPRYIQGYKKSRKGSEGAGVALIVSLTPILQAVSMEQVALIQFLTDVASSLGFWFGLSAIGIIGTFRSLLQRLVTCRGRETKVFAHSDYRTWKQKGGLDGFRILQTILTIQKDIESIKKQQSGSGRY